MKFNPIKIPEFNNKEEAFEFCDFLGTETQNFSVFTPVGSLLLTYYRDKEPEIDDDDGNATAYINALLMEEMPVDKNGYTIHFPPTAEQLMNVLSGYVRVIDDTLYGGSWIEVKKLWEKSYEIMEEWDDESEE